MTNPYYIPSGTPPRKSAGSSASVRAEFAAIGTAFDKLPTLASNAKKVAFVNTTGTAMTTAPVYIDEVTGSLMVGSSAPGGYLFRVDGGITALTNNTANQTIAEFRNTSELGYGLSIQAGWNSRYSVLVNNANAEFQFMLDGKGSMIAAVSEGIPFLTNNRTLSFQLESNTALKILVRGSDGTVRSATLTLT